MMKTKKRNKIIFAVVLVLLLTFTTVFSSFADQYGEVYYQVVQGYPTGGVAPLPVEVGENNYTFCLFLNLYWNVPQQVGISNWSYSFSQRMEDGNTTVTTLTLNYQEVTVSGTFGTSTFTPSNTPTGTLVIPYYYIATISNLNILNLSCIEILNNEQLTGANEQNGYNVGYEQGYEDGLADGQAENEFVSAGAQLIFSVVEAPFNVLRQMLNFNLLGVNLFGLVMSIFTLCLVATVIRFLI